MELGGSARRLSRRGFVAAAAALLVAALAPAAASAATFNFFNSTNLGPSQNGGIVGPATTFPSSTAVSGLTGTLSKVTVTLLEFESGSPDDIDALLVGPEGQRVMLMSDSCGTAQNFENDYWTFDDDAPAGLSNAGPCASNQVASYKPTNHAGGAPEPDLFPAGGGIAPPYEGALAVFEGGDPNGPWDLYVNDDSESVVGFGFPGWLLTLEVEPALAPVPGVGAGPPVPVPPTAKKPTGQRARALAKCKTKKTAKAKARCRKNAKKLPL